MAPGAAPGVAASGGRLIRAQGGPIEQHQHIRTRHQGRGINLFTDTLKYRPLNDRAERACNHCIAEGLLSAYLAPSGRNIG